MNIILWIIFGGLAGWIASILAGADAAYGVLGNIVVGIVGAFIGGWVADFVGARHTSEAERPSNIMSFVWAVLGALLLLLLLNLLL